MEPLLIFIYYYFVHGKLKEKIKAFRINMPLVEGKEQGIDQALFVGGSMCHLLHILRIDNLNINRLF